MGFVLLKKDIQVIARTLAVNVLQCVAECCKGRIAMYSCNPTHRHACYGVATTSRLLKIIGLFCKRAL